MPARPLLITTVTTVTTVSAVLLSGCGSGAGDAGGSSEPENRAVPESVEQPVSADDHHLDRLHADSLHPDITPAEPGQAHIEVGDQRFDFIDITCTVNNHPGAASYDVVASQEATGAGHWLYLTRQVGPDVGFNFENERVQLSLFDPDDGGRMRNSLAQHGRDEGEEPEWGQGGGESPLVRVVGDEATATGTFDADPFTSEPGEVTFTAAATCP